MIALNVVQKILKEHLVSGNLKAGETIYLKIDEALIQDATGTMLALEFEKMGVKRIQTESAVVFIDHNTPQADFRNKDDHRYLQSIAQRYGMHISLPGNGICHQVYLERFAKPGKTLVGSDSHTPTAGGMGQLAFGAGGLDVAAVLAGQPYELVVPQVVLVRLSGCLPPFVSAKDVVLELLSRVGVKGGRGKVFEYGGNVEALNVPERATICNMGAETGATTSIFPSDQRTEEFLLAQGRYWGVWPIRLAAHEGALYDEIINIDLLEVEPLVACPHSPGNVKRVQELEGMPVNQVVIGSCTNSSLRDLKMAAVILKDQKIHPNIDLLIAPGSRQVLTHIAREGDLEVFVQAGARILECTCGPCIGMGGAPGSGEVSLRTFNRNFEGRSGTKDAQVYLVSPETAALSAVEGKLADPRRLPFNRSDTSLPRQFYINDNRILEPLPPEEAQEVEIKRGSNIVALPDFPKMPQDLQLRVLGKFGNDITTDHIMPAGSKILPLRSNLPEIAKYVFSGVDSDFHQKAEEIKETSFRGIIVAGENYGQGSSREHAALAPKYLGIDVVLVKSFARIHLANLINFGILPLEFVNPQDYDKIDLGDILEMKNTKKAFAKLVTNLTKGEEYLVKHTLPENQIEIVMDGGVLNYFKRK